MTCIDCGMPADGRRCKTCQRAHERDGDWAIDLEDDDDDGAAPPVVADGGVEGVCFGAETSREAFDASVGTVHGSEHPLDRYEPRGYVRTAEDANDLALDAAVALTASSWGPPFATAPHEADGEWWESAYHAACGAVERAIVDSITAALDAKQGGGGGA